MWEIFTPMGNVTLLSDVAGIYLSNQNAACVVRSRFCNKIAKTMLQNIDRIELFETCDRYWTYLAGYTCNLQLSSTYVAE